MDKLNVSKRLLGRCMKSLGGVILMSSFMFVCGPVRGQKVNDLVYTDARELSLIGQGFETAEGYTRLPENLKGKVRDAVWDLGQNSAGLAIRFRSNSSCIGARWTLLNNFSMAHMAGTGIRGLDLYALDGKGNWRFVGTAQPNGKESANIFVRRMNGEEKEFLMYLPLYDGVVKLEVGVDSTAYIAKPQESVLTGVEGKKPVVFYGTSITQGGCVSRPGMAYPAIVSRKLQRDAVNLGFSGNGRMDRVMADEIAGIDACAYVIDCLPNCTQEIVKDSTEYFIGKIARTHPQVPVYMVSNPPFPYVWVDARDKKDLEDENALWYALYEKLKKEGCSNLQYINVYDGKWGEFLGGDEEETVDGVHLTDTGAMRLAEIFCKELSRQISR